MNQHVPVLLKESVDLLIKNKNGIYFDGTIGFGGHSSEIITRLQQKGKLIATDKDIEAFVHSQRKFADDKRISVYNASFTEIDTIAKIEFIEKFDGIFVDLGVSSYQLDNVESGFTFREDSPLDLRMNKKSGISASYLLNNFTQEQISEILFTYGEEKLSRKIARFIVEKREVEKFNSTLQLKKIVEKVIPPNYVNKSLSRIFQALRIYVNNELEELKNFLDKSIDLLCNGGRLVILSYHSLEDRIVKEKFKYESLRCVCPPKTPICICGKKQSLILLNSKPIIPSDLEINKNRRARSAKLRVAEKVQS
ncbi:MAG: 16S rRNA (cytosine(1402)-N(4))-methyltransferase RsmH [Ignavibacteria bacterium]|nr:16S rRNA (cytosine(1402)-N(4))-methyltransferase RsmH [Ignavibacteria bacterium]